MDNEEFLSALADGMPEDERMIICAFHGDPNKVPLGAWKPRAWAAGKPCPTGAEQNAFVTISSFRRAADGTWRRRGETWAAGRALMIDDLGTKVPLSAIDPLPPTALIETSPDNFQAWYFLGAPERDKWRFDALIRAFIEQRLAAADPGMSGVTRVGRLPRGANGKEKYGGAWPTRVAAWHPERRFTTDGLIAAFGLKLAGRRRLEGAVGRLASEDAAVRVEMFGAALRWMRDHRMLKKAEPDLSGWMEVTCPWVDSHTGRADTGAAIRLPEEENAYYGAFRCHHGHCAHRGWAELTEWIAEAAIEQLERSATA